jgi:hypothetical protein
MHGRARLADARRFDPARPVLPILHVQKRVLQEIGGLACMRRTLAQMCWSVGVGYG